ncbi:MAG: DUF1580 domain-containing protein [Phycisphaera sp. RhM]|nr:DUF1580 domain-containing protein [Phycisphaera sp. RhM]
MSVSTANVTQNVRQVLTEDVITLQDARRELIPFLGRRPDKATLYRWCLRGVKGTKLEHVRIGNRILTSRQAITRFIESRTATG